MPPVSLRYVEDSDALVNRQRPVVCFIARKETLSEVFGSEPLSPEQVMAKLWAFVVEKDLWVK